MARYSEFWCLVPRLQRHGLSLANEAGLIVSSLVRSGLAYVSQATLVAPTTHAALEGWLLCTQCKPFQVSMLA